MEVKFFVNNFLPLEKHFCHFDDGRNWCQEERNEGCASVDSVRESWKSRERQTEVCAFLSTEAQSNCVKSSQHLSSVLIFMGPAWPVVKNLTHQCRRAGNISMWFRLLSCRSLRSSNPFQDSHLGNPKGRRAWWATAHGVATSQTGLSTLILILSFSMY